MPIKVKSNRRILKKKYSGAKSIPEKDIYPVTKHDRFDGIKRWMKRDGELYEMHYDYASKEHAERVAKNIQKARPSTKTFIVKRLSTKGKLKYVLYERRKSKVKYKRAELKQKQKK